MASFNKVVVANRGAVASRIIRALRSLGIASVAVFSDADAQAPYLAEADEAVHIGEGPPLASYLNQETMLRVIESTGADGVHPGYGFLAENADFAGAIQARGVRWIGPSPEWIRLMGNKTRARAFAESRGLPLAPGSSLVSTDPAEIVAAAHAVGFPVLVKPAGGGGGIGMLPAADPEELLDAVERASSMASRSFADGSVYLERLVREPRHVEYQILSDEHGDMCHLFERDCSVQRRRQKIIEEAPAPGLERSWVLDMADRFVKILREEGYNNIGTMETLVSGGDTHFLEMNTRLQVEHGVTEEVTGIDLVQAQIRLAAGDRLADVVPSSPEVDGHAVEARVYAEDPIRFFPSPGHLEVFDVPDGVRVETGFRQGMDVTPFYDPLLAKVIAHGPTRQQAIDSLVAALAGFTIRGVKNNIPALIAILRSKAFSDGALHTDLATEVVTAQKSEIRSMT